MTATLPCPALSAPCVTRPSNGGERPAVAATHELLRNGTNRRGLVGRIVFIVYGSDDFSDLMRAEVVGEDDDSVLVRVGAKDCFPIFKGKKSQQVFLSYPAALKAHRRNIGRHIAWLMAEVKKLHKQATAADPLTPIEEVFGDVAAMISTKLNDVAPQHAVAS